MGSMETVKRFVDAINSHDVKGLVGLMTGDHAFVDSLGDEYTRPAIETGWAEYFDMVPDYFVEIDKTAILDDDSLILVGRAGGTYAPGGAPLMKENGWQSPAVWIAKVHGSRVSEWRKYSDNEAIRARMRANNR